MAQLNMGTTIGGYTAWHSGNIKNLFEAAQAVGTVDAKLSLRELYIAKTANIREKVGIGFDVAPTHTLNIGDADTGFNWRGDGQFDIVSNGASVLDIRNDKVNTNKPLREYSKRVVTQDFSGSNDFSRLVPEKSVWFRAPTDNGGFLPYAPEKSFLGASTWNWGSIYGVNIFENNVKLVDKYLGKTGGSITGNLEFEGNSRSIYLTGGDTNSQNKIVIGESDLYGLSLRWDSEASVQFDSFWNTSVKGAPTKNIGNVHVESGVWNFNSIQENGTALSDKYLGKTATAANAANADKLDNLDSTAFGRLGVKSAWSKKQEFYTNLSNNADWVNSPISIRERDLVNNAQSANKYAPNLNFHWGGRASTSLWMDANGTMHLGSWDGSGNPTTSGKFAANEFIEDGNKLIDKYFKFGKENVSSMSSDNRLELGTSSASNWAYHRLKSSDQHWDIAMRKDDRDGALQFRAQGSSVGCWIARNGDFYFNNYGVGMVGQYSATKFQQIFAMGGAYTLPDNGDGTSNFYGLAYTHSNNTDAHARKISGHQLLVMNAGQTRVALGDGGIWSGQTIKTDGSIIAAGSVTANGGLIQDGHALTNGTDTWYRTTNDDGIFFSKWGGGLYMSDGTWVRTYGSKQFYVDNTASNAIYTAGGVTATKDVTAFSDKRVKKNIKRIDNALEKVCSIRGVTFDRVDTKEPTRQAGVIAQEIQKVLPEVVITHEVKKTKLIKDGKQLNVAYGNISALLIEAIKEEKSKRENLAAKVKEQDAKMDLMQQQIEILMQKLGE